MVKVKFLNFLCTWCYGYELHNFFAVGDELVESETTSHAQLDCFLHCGGWLESVIILWPHQWKWRKLHCSSLTWTWWNMPSISQENVKGSCLKLHWSVTGEHPSQSNKTINFCALSLNFCGTFVSTCCWAGRFGSEILDRSCFSVETMVFFVGFKVTVLFNSDFYFLITLAGESSPCNSPCSFMHSSSLSWSFNLLRSLPISWCLFKVSHLL